MQCNDSIEDVTHYCLYTSNLIRGTTGIFIMIIRCVLAAVILLVLGCEDGGMGGRTWTRVEGPRQPIPEQSSEYGNRYDNAQLAKTQLESIPVVSYSFDAKSRMGKLSVDITGKGIEVRSWIVKNIGKICSSHNVVLEAGKEPAEGGRYEIIKESAKDGILTIEFKALY